MDAMQETQYVILQAISLIQPTLPPAEELIQQAELLDLDSVTYHQKIQWKNQFATAHDFCKGTMEHFFYQRGARECKFHWKGELQYPRPNQDQEDAGTGGRPILHIFQRKVLSMESVHRFDAD